MCWVGRNGYIYCNCFDWRILWRVCGRSKHTHSYVGRTVCVKGGIQQCWVFNVGVMLTGGPLCQSAKRLDDIAQGVSNVVVKGGLVVATRKEVITKRVHLLLAMSAMCCDAASKCERHPEFALIEDGEHIIIEPVVWNRSAEVVEWL